MATQTIGDLSLDSILVEEAGRISADIHRNTIDTSAWLKLVPQDTWPDEMGDTISVLTYERSIPADTNTWSTVSNAGGSTKFCIPDAVTVPVAQTLRTYGLAHTAIESDPICINDVRMSFRFREQLANIYANLTENVALIWRDRNRDEYSRLAEHKIVAALTAENQLVEDKTTFSTDVPATNISRLTQGILDRIYMKLITDGGGQKPMGRENGRPTFTLITSAETSDRIIRQAEIRDDFRYSQANVSELLKPLGVERSYRGFYHVIDTFPRRWNLGAGGWEAVPAYIEDVSEYDGKQGSTNRYIVNPEYFTAEYEDSFIYHQEVMQTLIPRPLSNAGSGVTFDPHTYRGDFKWKNIVDRVNNPDGSWGYFRGVLASGSKPVRPQFGFVIRHKRCDAPDLLLDCANGAVDALVSP